jgi:hypothetical protein
MKDINQWIFEIPLEDIKTDNEKLGQYVRRISSARRSRLVSNWKCLQE